MFVAPDDLVRLEIDGEDLVLVGAVIGAAAGDHRRRSGVGPERHRVELLAVADPDGAKDLVAARYIRDTIGDCRRRVDVSLRLHFPQELSVSGAEGVEV